MASVKLNITPLDFDTLKTSLQQYLSSQSVFEDYDFTGSNLSTLLDILTANTHYLSFYLNMVGNEAFLDSADLRSSIVSLAKLLSYVPQSRNASTAVVNFTIIPPAASNPQATLVVPQYTPFNTTVNGINYTFITDVDHSVALDISSNTYILNNITLREGTSFSFRYTVDDTLPDQRFIIPNPNIDTNTLSVRVQNSTSDTTITVYTLADDINTIDGTTPVYFIQEVEDEQYEVYFGDGVLGQAVQNGNIIILDYIACNADAPNFANIFTSSQSIGGFGNIQVTTVTPAYGGAEREDTETIRFRAPKSFEAQNRAVTVQDYQTILLQNYPNVNSLSIWGGEDNNPPVYGQVFISLQPSAGYVLTESSKLSIVNDILAKKNILTVIPTIIDPDYIFITINSLVKYDPNLTTLTADAIKSLVINTINNFGTNNISKFSLDFKYSNLISEIDSSENSISNNITNILIQKRIVPQLNTIQSFVVNFNLNNSIIPGSISSSQFVSNAIGFQVLPGDIHTFIDDRNGNLQIIKQVGTETVVVKSNAGTVDYINGIVNINAFSPASIVGPNNFIKIFAVPVSQDIIPIRNNIITIDPLDVTVNVITVSNILL